MTRLLPIKDPELLSARLGMLMAAGLSEQCAVLPHDISERLRVAREQAVARARQVRRQAASPPVVVSMSGGVAVMGSGPRWWQRVASALPLLLLVAGLLLIDRWTEREQVLAAAEIDAVLLADDLPPNAYADPGFTEFLRSPPP